MSNRIQRKAISYLLIINLIGGLFIPSLASAMGAETRVLLCTSQGYQWVTLETEQELQLTGDTLGNEHCIYCISSDDDIEQAVFVYSYLELVATEYLFIINTGHIAPNDHFLVSRQPRAPPFFI